MTNAYALGYEQPWERPRAERERLPMISALVLLFILGALAIAPIPGGNTLVQILGVVLAVGYAIRSLVTKLRVPPEVLLYAAFMAWSITGLFAHPNMILYRDRLFTVLQILVMFFIVASFVTSRRTFMAVLITYFVAVAIAVVAAVFGVGDRHAVEGRVASMDMNINEFGRLMVWGTAVMMYLWSQSARGGNLRKLILLPGMCATAIMIVLTASRFSILGLALLYVAWIWFAYRKEARQRLGLLVVVVLGLGIALSGMYMLTRRTHAGERFADMTLSPAGIAGDQSVESRAAFYRIGGEITLRSPVFGIGLNNFRMHTPGLKYSHSEYIEIFTGTGLPGAALYFSIFIILYRRAGKIAKATTDANVARGMGLIKATIVAMLFLGFGQENYRMKPVYILLGAFAGYTYAVMQQMRQARALSEEGVVSNHPDEMMVTGA